MMVLWKVGEIMINKQFAIEILKYMDELNEEIINVDMKPFEERSYYEIVRSKVIGEIADKILDITEKHLI